MVRKNPSNGGGDLLVKVINKMSDSTWFSEQHERYLRLCEDHRLARLDQGVELLVFCMVVLALNPTIDDVPLLKLLVARADARHGGGSGSNDDGGDDGAVAQLIHKATHRGRFGDRSDENDTAGKAAEGLLVEYDDMLLHLVARLVVAGRDRSALEGYQRREHLIQETEARLIDREREVESVVRHGKEARELLTEAKALRDSARLTSTRNEVRGDFDHLWTLMGSALEGRSFRDKKGNPGYVRMDLKELFESYYKPGFHLITRYSYFDRSEKDREGWRPIHEVLGNRFAAFKRFDDRRLEAKDEELKCLLAEDPDCQVAADCVPALG